MKVSFDFDSTLSENYIQEIAKRFIAFGDDVYIVTSRVSDNVPIIGIPQRDYSNKDLHAIADDLGIKHENRHFTQGAFKSETIKSLGIELHFDDMEDEVEKINNETECKALLVGLSVQMLAYLYSKK